MIAFFITLLFTHSLQKMYEFFSYSVHYKKIVNILEYYQEIIIIFIKILYLILDYPHKHYTFKHFEV